MMNLSELFLKTIYKIFIIVLEYHICRPRSLSELVPMIFNMGLTHLGSEASILSTDIIEKHF